MARACAVDKRPARVTKLRMRRSFGSYSMCLSVSGAVFSDMNNENKNSAKNTAKQKGKKIKLSVASLCDYFSSQSLQAIFHSGSVNSSNWSISQTSGIVI